MSYILPTVKLIVIFLKVISDYANLSYLSKDSINKANMHMLELGKYLQRIQKAVGKYHK